MIGNAKIGAALVGGYLLGRTKKAKAAIGLGMFLAGRKLDLDPRQIARTLAASPALSGLGDQARREIVDVTKSAATTALTDRANHFADSLRERRLRLGGPDGTDAADEAVDTDEDVDEDDREETYEHTDEHTDEDRDRDERAEREKPAKRPAPRRRAPEARPATKPAKSAPKSTAKTARRSAPKNAKARSGGRGGDDG